MNLVQFTNLKMNFSVHFSVHLKNISKGSMPKSQFRGVFISQCFKNFEFFGKNPKKIEILVPEDAGIFN